MSGLERRFVRVPIYVDAQAPTLCNAASSGSEDGCDAFLYDDDGAALCGAYGEFLIPLDADENCGHAPHIRCKPCFQNEISK